VKTVADRQKHAAYQNYSTSDDILMVSTPITLNDIEPLK